MLYSIYIIHMSACTRVARKESIYLTNHPYVSAQKGLRWCLGDLVSALRQMMLLDTNGHDHIQAPASSLQSSTSR